MEIKQLTLKQFRNAQEETLRFTSGVNVLFGKNASGKTNILESMFFFAAGKSFRGCKDRDLIRFGSEFAKAELCFIGGGLEQALGVTLAKNKKRIITRNGIRVQKLSEYLGLFRAVIFTPDHLHLVKGAPEGRRRFLDLAICQSFPRHAVALHEYNRLLQQKNALLKKRDGVDGLLLETYHARMATLAAYITRSRAGYAKKLEGFARGFQSEMSDGSEELALKYVSQVKWESGTQEELAAAYAELFARHVQAEIARGAALVGPQKDDFEVLLNEKNARLYGSQGQQRSAVLSLKLAEGELSRQLTGEYPVFLLDDVLSELDGSRRAYVLSRMGGKQVVLTGCEPELFEAYREANRIYVENGVARNV